MTFRLITDKHGIPLYLNGDRLASDIPEHAVTFATADEAQREAERANLDSGWRGWAFTWEVQPIPEQEGAWHSTDLRQIIQPKLRPDMQAACRRGCARKPSPHEN